MRGTLMMNDLAIINGCEMRGMPTKINVVSTIGCEMRSVLKRHRTDGTVGSGRMTTVGKRGLEKSTTNSFQTTQKSIGRKKRSA